MPVGLDAEADRCHLKEPKEEPTELQADTQRFVFKSPNTSGFCQEISDNLRTRRENCTVIYTMMIKTYFVKIIMQGIKNKHFT